MDSPKKYWLGLITLLFISLLSGCFGSAESPILEDVPYETFQGTLQSLGHVNFSAKATHLLRQTNGSILYVYSDFYDLNREDYLNRTLEVSGLLLPPDELSTRETLSIDSLTVLTEEIEELGAVAMQAYTNEALGFSWLFRNDWSIDALSDRVTFTAPLPEMTSEAPSTKPMMGDTIEIRTMPNLQELPIEDWYLQYIIPAGTISPYTNSAIGPETLSAIRADVKNVDGNVIMYYVADGPQVFLISHNIFQKDHGLEYGNLFSDMLYSFDPLRDGVREVATPSAPPVIPPSSDEVSTTPTSSPTFDYQSIVDALEKVRLGTLIPQSGVWSATHYDFADPNYVYVTYQNTAGTKGLILLTYTGNDFERVAAFEEGTLTDWTLVSGVDVAKGKTKTSFNASSGVVITIPEGYRSMESASLHFQMHYPSSWYYSRSGDFFYFSNQPADASNALVSMEVIDSPVPAYREESSSGTPVIFVPRDETSGFKFQSTSDYFDIVQIMAKSILLTNV